MSFSFDHTGWQSTVESTKKFQGKVVQNFKDIHTQELYTTK